MHEGSCHCGAVRFEYPGEPEWLLSCNCSICRRLSTLWAYAPVKDMLIEKAENATLAYCWGDRMLELHTCRTCGCTTHWIGTDGDESSKMAVNFRLCDPAEISHYRIRRFDGADSWEFLD